MKNYEKIINKYNVMQNSVALAILLESGRKNILDEKNFKELSKGFINANNPFMTVEYQKGALEISKKLAEMKEKDLYDFIYDKVKEERKLEKGRY